MKTPILLICYSFPPHPGIGGRRWAKFSKYLAKRAYKIEVFNAYNIFSENSLWIADTLNENIKVNSFLFQFQELIYQPKNIAQKIRRKLLNLKGSKYNSNIITSYPNLNFWNAIENKIRSEGIQKVIVSGDPFLFYYASCLKKKLSFELILDYRDLWNDHTFYQKNVSLSQKQKEFFEFCENEAVNACDKIIFVDEYLKETVSKRIRNKNTRIDVIPNGLDTDDINEISHQVQNNDGKIKLFFWGSISSDLNDQLYHFIESFAQLKKTNNSLYSEFTITIGGIIDSQLLLKIRSLDLENVIIEAGSITKKDYYSRLSAAEIGITLNSEEYKNSFVTKFSDYLFLNKFILNISSPGKFNDFITENRIGITFKKTDDSSFFEGLKKEFKEYKQPNNELLQSFELSHLTNKLEEFIYS